jgi:glutathione peroxidase
MKVHEYVFQSINGGTMPLERWKGQPLLLVNTASKCGYTPQYAKLERLWQDYRNTGLVIIGIPSNDFGAQEPGTDEEIESFCTTEYGVSFPMTSKQQVLGNDCHPLFTALREEFTSEALPQWNFFKYLFGRDGNLIKFWSSAVEPDDIEFRKELERHAVAWIL